MSSKYKIKNPNGIYFIPFATVQWKINAEKDKELQIKLIYNDKYSKNPSASAGF